MSSYSVIRPPRRRARRAAVAVTAVLAGLVVGLVLAGRTVDRAHRVPLAAPAAATAAPFLQRHFPPSPAGYATAPAPAGQRVHIAFRRPPGSGLLFDLRTGRVLWALHPRRRVRIASLTKMMTALIVVAREPRRARALITPQAVHYSGSGVGVLPQGRRVGVQPLLYGLLLPSGNDAAIALAQRVAGTVPRFVALMNARARELGLRCMRFSSPSGIRDRGNASCAPDLAVLARDLLANPRLARIVGTRHVTFAFPVKGGHLDLYNNNPLMLMRYPGVTGVKTGFTDAAGRCLVASARRGPVRLGVVLLHSPNPGAQARRLLDAGFRTLHAPAPPSQPARR